MAGGLSVVLMTAAAASEGLSWDWAVRWGLAALVILLILCVEITGTTPVYKSGLQEDRLLQIVLDSDLCGGIGTCEQVCPTDVFKVSPAEQTAALVGEKDCVQCGACIVQCPLDALYFSSPGGGKVTPDAVRKYKLNLLGKRLVKSGS
jgi:NAD-dependent dihydropyrimidine dehydrogenase PreA subunit